MIFCMRSMVDQRTNAVSAISMPRMRKTAKFGVELIFTLRVSNIIRSYRFAVTVLVTGDRCNRYCNYFSHPQGVSSTL